MSKTKLLQVLKRARDTGALLELRFTDGSTVHGTVVEVRATTFDLEDADGVAHPYTVALIRGVEVLDA